jgi:hypothetical protein
MASKSLTTAKGQLFDPGKVLAFVGIGIVLFIVARVGVSQFQALTFLFALSPLWLPYVTFYLFFEKWMDMIGLEFYLNNGRTTLEIKLPPEVFKSPEAMETVIAQIHNVNNPDNYMQTFIDGKRPLPYSLELVSTGGQVKFYVNLPTKKTKELFKVNLYSQYPGVEIVEVPLDYTAEIPSNLEGYECMAVHMGKKKNSEYPIKVYTEFGLDKLPKEEEKLDPMTPMLEALGSIKPYERVWIQIICTPHREKKFINGQLQKAPTWEVAGRAEIDKIMRRDPKTKIGAVEMEGAPRLTPGERNMVEMMETNLSKYAYEVGIRWLYLTPTGKFTGDVIPMIIRTFTQYDIQGRNGIGARWRTDFDYPMFSDPLGTKIPAYKREELKRYKLRKYINRTANDEAKIFTSLELATMYHLPGKVALTPNLQRITSTRSEAPSNLPVGNYSL